MIRRSALAGLVFALSIPELGTQVLSALGEEIHAPLVSVAWLKVALSRSDLAIIDIRGQKIEDAFAMAHMPGAVWSKYPGGWRGNGPISGAEPTSSALEMQISALGISNDAMVVIVPAGSNSTEFGGAARVYWSFKYAGHDKVAILDGGWAAWVADEENSVEIGVAVPTASRFLVDLRPDLVATTQEVKTVVGTSTVLLDARPQEQYWGQSKSAAAKQAGHIPGALSLDNALFYNSVTNRIKPSSELVELLPEVMADRNTEIITYCNAGHWSATEWFVLHEILGYVNVSLYADSLIGWTANPNNPVEK